MNGDHHMWRGWATLLHRWGLQEVVASLLESVGPLTIVGAQLLYIGQPWLNSLLPEAHLREAARLLEDPGEAQEFVAFLREAA